MLDRRRPGIGPEVEDREGAEGAAEQRRSDRDGRRAPRPGRRGRDDFRSARDHVLQLDAGVADVAQAGPRVLSEATLDEAPEGRRRALDAAEVGGLGCDLGEQRADGVAAERACAHQHLEEHAAEGPDVRTAVEPLALDLLGRHVRGSAEDRAVRRERGVVLADVEVLREPEVEHLHVAVGGELDVAGLQVAVDDAALVGALERGGDLVGRAQHLLQRQRAFLQAVGKGGALDQLEDEHERAVRGLDAVDLADMGMVQRGEHLGFAAQPRDPVGIGGEAGGEHLQRDAALEARVDGAVDLAHAALAELPRDLVVGNPLPDQRRRPWHASVARAGHGRNLGLAAVRVFSHPAARRWPRPSIISATRLWSTAPPYQERNRSASPPRNTPAKIAAKHSSGALCQWIAQ